MSSVEELYEFIETFDISENKDPHQYHVVPERVLQEFVSSNRARFKELLDRDPFKDKCPTMIYQLYMKEAQANRQYPQIPRLNNALRLFLFRPRNKGVSLVAIRKKLTKDILTTRNILVNRPNNASLDAIIDSFAKEFSSNFPDYYMVFTPYGSEMNGLAITAESRVNINIELDKVDLDRLVNRDKSPFANDLREPHCFRTTKIFKQSVNLHDDKFNKSSIQLTNDIYIEYSFNTAIVTKGTYLIEEYMRLDGRVTPFLIALKNFAIRKVGGKSTYTFINMGIAYLLSLDPPVIPNLQNINLTDITDTCMDDDCLSKMVYWDYAVYQNEYIGGACRYHTCIHPKRDGKPCKDAPLRDPSTKKTYWTSSNDMSVGELFLDCMHYYGYTFDYNIYAISIKHDGKTRRKPVFQGQPIVVEDPVLSGVNVAYEYNNQDKLREQFQRAFVLLYKGSSFGNMMHARSSEPLVEDKKYKLSPRRRKALGQVRTCLLMGLPAAPIGMCDCDAIEESLSQFASIEKLQNLDKDVVLVSLGIREMVVLPFHVDIGGNKVQLVELFEVNQRR